VTEFNSSDGGWVRTVRAGSYGFSGPLGIAFDGSHLWVMNSTGNSATELNASNGSWVRTVTAGSYGFNLPSAVAFDGSHLWVANNGGNSVTEILSH
jgi:DNA-binding beta-propeller fold protein YncE